MPFKIVRNNITLVKADAIVNTANPMPVVGGGTDSAIYDAAGREELLSKRMEIGEIKPGDARVTDAFALDAKYIIHTVGPMWIDGAHGEMDVLRKCYRNSLELAGELSCKSIAFPLISTGVYGFPKDEALQIALAEINRFLLKSDMMVILVVFDRKSFELSGKLLTGIEEYIDENSVDMTRKQEYGPNSISSADERLNRLSRRELHHSSLVQKPEKKLSDVLGEAGKSFQDKLFELIDASGMTDVKVYKKANVDRKLFSSIKCKKDYKPSKKTAVSFAIALELDMAATKDLLGRAGFALSPSSRFDLIISYFIEQKKYDIYEINAALFEYDEQILG